MSDASEIIKSGAADKLADIVHKLAGPLAEEYGQILADKAKVYRLKNWVNVVTKTQKILSDAELPPNAVPPRMFLPIIEASSLEDDETLQDLWAGLLATASQQADSVSPSFVETLKQLTPDEARHLQRVYKTHQGIRKQERLVGTPLNASAFRVDEGAPPGASETFRRLGLIEKDFDVELRKGSMRRQVTNLAKTIDAIELAIDSIEPEISYSYLVTRYMDSFLEACNGPRPSVEPSAATD